MDKEGRKKFVGGNWKSNNTLEQSRQLVVGVLNKIDFDPKFEEVVVAPVFMQIPWVQQNLNPKIQIAAQNASNQKFGAFTGEISPLHITDFGLHWVIIGHSERRQYYGETDDVVAGKTKFCLDNKLSVIACVGEKLPEREAGQTLDVVSTQLKAICKALTKDDWERVVVAYEPVWAIGTGKVATPEQAQEVHDMIRKFLCKEVGHDVSIKTRIIYGGSVTGKNCTDLIKQRDVDGFLVGGASLKPEFTDIVASCNN